MSGSLDIYTGASLDGGGDGRKPLRPVSNYVWTGSLWRPQLSAADGSVSIAAPTAQSSNPFTRAQINIGSATTTVIVAGVSAQTIKFYRMLLTIDAADTIDIQDTTPAALDGGPLAFGANSGTILDYSGVPWFVTAVGKGLQFVTTTGANVRGFIDYLQG